MKTNYPQNDDIACLEAAINYTIFHLKNGKQLISSYTLKKYEESNRLNTFLRINRKFLVNPTFVEQVRFEKKTQFVLLVSGKELQVSRRRIVRFTNNN